MLCSKAYHGLYNIRQIQKYLDVDTTKTLINAFVISHIDYCNSLLVGLPDYQLARVQRIMNGAARLIFCLPKFCHISDTLRSLHWLPVKERVEFKLILQVFKCLKGLAPNYLIDMITVRSSAYNLRSQTRIVLHVPRIHHRIGERAFVYKGPWLWNRLPAELALVESFSVDVFKGKLKAHLFRQAYPV